MTDDPITKDTPSHIITEHGVVPEWARRQAVLNMRRDPKKKAEMIARFGEALLRQNYPEAFEDDETQA